MSARKRAEQVTRPSRARGADKRHRSAASGRKRDTSRGTRMEPLRTAGVRAMVVVRRLPGLAHVAEGRVSTECVPD